MLILQPDWEFNLQQAIKSLATLKLKSRGYTHVCRTYNNGLAAILALAGLQALGWHAIEKKVDL